MENRQELKRQPDVLEVLSPIWEKEYNVTAHSSKTNVDEGGKVEHICAADKTYLAMARVCNNFLKKSSDITLPDYI